MSQSNHLRPFFYDIVGDIYIAKNNFLLAEVYILQALSMGHSSFKVYFNLSTLASIRKDFILAHFYLDKASDIDPNHSQLVQMRDNLTQLQDNTTRCFSFSDIPG